VGPPHRRPPPASLRAPKTAPHPPAAPPRTRVASSTAGRASRAKPASSTRRASRANPSSLHRPRLSRRAGLRCHWLRLSAPSRSPTSLPYSPAPAKCSRLPRPRLAHRGHHATSHHHCSHCCRRPPRRRLAAAPSPSSSRYRNCHNELRAAASAVRTPKPPQPTAANAVDQPPCCRRRPSCCCHRRHELHAVGVAPCSRAVAATDVAASSAVPPPLPGSPIGRAHQSGPPPTTNHCRASRNRRRPLAPVPPGPRCPRRRPCQRRNGRDSILNPTGHALSPPPHYSGEIGPLPATSEPPLPYLSIPALPSLFFCISPSSLVPSIALAPSPSSPPPLPPLR